MKENEINLDIKEKLQNIKNRNICIIVFAIIIGCIIIGFVFCDADLTHDDKLLISNTNMTVEHYTYFGYSVNVTGIAKNTTKKDFSYASVEFSVYDANGNNLGTAIANINNLLAGDTWSFDATLIGFANNRPASYKLVNVIIL